MKTAVLLELLKTREVWTWSNERLGKACGFSSRTISRHLAELEKTGAIVIARHSPNSGGPGSDPVGRKIWVKDITDKFSNEP